MTAHPFNPDLIGDCQDCPLPKVHEVHVPLPDLPYAGTSGWSGSDTSHERAIEADRNGATTARQEQVLAGLGMVGSRGLTWKELAGSQGWHHGQASGVLSVLHKAERIARLTERRNRCRVYVLPEHVNGRETDTQGRKAIDPNVVQRVEWSVLLPSGARKPFTTQEEAEAYRYLGERVQFRTVIETPWEDMPTAAGAAA